MRDELVETKTGRRMTWTLIYIHHAMVRSTTMASPSASWTHLEVEQESSLMNFLLRVESQASAILLVRWWGRPVGPPIGW